MADTAHKGDRAAAAVLALASAILLAAWPGWWLRDDVPADAYGQAPDVFVAVAERFAAAHTVGVRDGLPLVEPLPGADIPVVARRFQFWPALRLHAGHTYRLHVAAADTVHSVAVAGHELALVPGQVRILTLTVRADRPVILQCGEYCGLGHNRMRAEVEVVP